MAKNGIRYPGVIDLVTQGDEGVRLVLVQTEPLASGDAEALQEKLNNYLSFALDGQLVAIYPEAVGKPIAIRVDLYAAPEEAIMSFLRAFRAATMDYDVSLEVSTNGRDLLL